MGAPFLIGDTSGWNPNPQFDAYVAAGLCGVILKASQGLAEGNRSPGWLKAHWPRARAAGGIGYGFTWLRGAYGLLNFTTTGRAQADFYLTQVERAGGWSYGDMLPCLDVESEHANAAGAARVEDTVSECAERIVQVMGREVILYSPFAKWTMGITSKMGCSRLWTPNYGPTMAVGALGKGPWTLDDVALWQYTDGKSSGPSNLPTRINVIIAGNRKPWLFDVHRQMRMNRLDPKIVAVLAGAAVAGATLG
jgi:GH25 family lysozyme M1 (1,4-beta-N-acetylmuramidase)